MSVLKVDCPVCGAKESAESKTKVDEIPYFGKIMESAIVCDVCGYKSTDVICLEQGEPVRFEIDINKDLLNARVVKAQSATVSIPELGLKVEPGPKSEGYVSNVESVLENFKSATKRALNMFCDEESQKNGELIIEKIDDLLLGKAQAKLIIEDPFGNSKILHQDSKSRKLSEEEVNNLKTGFTTFEASDFED
ncbi:MAG: ZPR1 zinc finger domain-containing protein [Methanobacteriaceae archaeon]